MSEPIYLQDLAVGDSFTSEQYLLDAEQIIRFAREYDPQPFHLDDSLAQGTFFKGLAASGWHTSAITMRLLVGSLPFAGGVIGATVELSWPQPTRPGDILRVRSTVASIAPSRSRPDRGMVVLECVTSNQRGEALQRMTSKVVCFRREE
ncbi:MaoC family dehydratase [Pseudomonas sp. GD03860]|uniref:MaoC family dehydratase n=1 Tax=Pseudomonas TaxID=286 RepID=UPI002363D649|nr:MULTISPECIES: MaoC family dehydratase [Pseudomonas]MDD2056774.1 MaoC family dehydratase [Pseudomonas putida]MDH0638030.1 MaoC family dehydratase [Pseudomonas sp. GD03860]